MNIRSSVWMSPGMRYYLGTLVVRGFCWLHSFSPFRPGSGYEPLYRCKIELGRLSDLGGWDYRPPWKTASTAAPLRTLCYMICWSGALWWSWVKINWELSCAGTEKRRRKRRIRFICRVNHIRAPRALFFQAVWYRIRSRTKVLWW